MLLRRTSEWWKYNAIFPHLAAMWDADTQGMPHGWEKKNIWEKIKRMLEEWNIWNVKFRLKIQKNNFISHEETWQYLSMSWTSLIGSFAPFSFGSHVRWAPLLFSYVNTWIQRGHYCLPVIKSPSSYSRSLYWAPGLTSLLTFLAIFSFLVYDWLTQ